MSRCEEDFFLTGGNAFLENGPRQDLLFGIKKEPERVLDTSAEDARVEVTFLKEENLKEEDGSFEEGDGTITLM